MACQSAFAPLMLRLALGVTFLWAGLGKVLNTVPYAPQDAALLANMGVLTPAPAKPAGNGAAAPSNRPIPSEPLPTPKDAPGSPPGLFALQNAPPTLYTEANFAEPVPERSLYHIALVVRRAAEKPEGAAKPFPLWPPMLAEGRWPVVFAWAVAIAELLGGLCVLVGLGTRFFGVALCGTMLGAIWLTEVGPAIRSGHTVLGFIPDYPGFAGALSPGGYVTLLWQFGLLCMAAAVVALGPGAVSLDAGLRKPSAPKPMAPKPKPPAA